MWHLKGLLAWSEGERETGVELLARAFAADPGGLGVGADLALALAELGRSEDAATVVERALDARPGDARLLALRD